jgi:UDP-N-acetylmuramate--alanine ligase
VLLLTEVYAAGEEPIPEADSAHLADAIRAHGHRDVTHIRSDQSLLESVLQRLQPGDVVLTLGAGDITRLGPQVVASLQGTDAGD